MAYKETFPSNNLILQQPPKIGLMVWEAAVANENSVWLEIHGNQCCLALAEGGKIKGSARFNIDADPAVQNSASFSRAQNITLSGPIFKGFLALPQTDEDRQDRLERLLWMSRIAADGAKLGLSLDQDSLREAFQYKTTEKHSAQIVELILGLKASVLGIESDPLSPVAARRAKI